MTDTIFDSAHTAEAIACRLAGPTPLPPDKPWLASSLTGGPAGISLLHSERARLGRGTWQSAHAWLKAASAGTVSAADNTGLYLGVAALTFALDAASERYSAALADLDGHVRDLAHRRVDTAARRLEAGVPGSFREYDIFFGLVGLGALLARRDPTGAALERVLSHVVALTRPLSIDGTEVPGWWVGHDPHRRQSPAFRAGHANLGAAHGVTGILLLLANTARQGSVVPGQLDAIARICEFLDQWEQSGERGPWWPQWLSLEDLAAGRPTQPGPGRPSWCYGAPSIARAQQIAAIALGETDRQKRAETSLTTMLADAVAHRRLTELGLCHGWAGTYMTVLRTDQDAADPELNATVGALADHLKCAAEGSSNGQDPGLLEGDAGLALALTAAAQQAAPSTGWDACLLID